MSIQYRDNIRAKYKALSKDEQLNLHKKLNDGDYSAREDLINSCLPLVYDIAKKFHFNNKHVEIDDLIQHGNIALIKAVDNWDVRKSNITTVATYYIRNALIDLIKDSKYNIRSKYDMTRQAAEDISKVKSCDSTDVETICSHTGLTPKRVKLLLSIMNGKRIEYTVMNHRLHSKENYDVVDEGNRAKGCLADLLEMVNTHIDSDIDKRVFVEWINYINKNNKTKTVANIVGISTEEVSQSVKRTKNILKGIFNG